MTDDRVTVRIYRKGKSILLPLPMDIEEAKEYAEQELKSDPEVTHCDLVRTTEVIIQKIGRNDF